MKRWNDQKDKLLLQTYDKFMQRKKTPESESLIREMGGKWIVIATRMNKHAFNPPLTGGACKARHFRLSNPKMKAATKMVQPKSTPKMGPKVGFNFMAADSLKLIAKALQEKNELLISINEKLDKLTPPNVVVDLLDINTEKHKSVI